MAQRDEIETTEAHGAEAEILLQQIKFHKRIITSLEHALPKNIRLRGAITFIIGICIPPIVLVLFTAWISFRSKGPSDELPLLDGLLVFAIAMPLVLGLYLVPKGAAELIGGDEWGKMLGMERIFWLLVGNFTYVVAAYQLFIYLQPKRALW